MHPLISASYGLRLLKSVLALGIGSASLVANLLPHRRHMDTLGVTFCTIFMALGAWGTFYYWRRINQGDRPRRKHRHAEAPTAEAPHRPAVVPTRRDQVG